MDQIPLTIFTCPKKFTGYWDILQKNAIRSWLWAAPDAEILLVTPEPDAAEVARELGVMHEPNVDCNEFGTPRLDSIFQVVHKRAEGRALMFVNADIVFPTKLDHALKFMRRSKILISGQRHNIDINEPLDFTSDKWVDLIRDKVQKADQPQHWGSDFFLFSRDMYKEMPPFAVGRVAFDNWLIYEAFRARAAVIDATPSIISAHQNHDYSHHPEGSEGVFNGTEAQRNRALLEHPGQADFGIWFADYQLLPTGLRKTTRASQEDRMYIDTMSAARPEVRITVPCRRVMSNLAGCLTKFSQTKN